MHIKRFKTLLTVTDITSVTYGGYTYCRIPYGSKIMVTAAQPKKDCTFWYIVRGAENYPLVLGDLTLPSHARLKLYINKDVELLPLQYLTMAEVHGKSGAILQTTLKVYLGFFIMLTKNPLLPMRSCFKF